MDNPKGIIYTNKNNNSIRFHDKYAANDLISKIKNKKIQFLMEFINILIDFIFL